MPALRSIYTVVLAALFGTIFAFSASAVVLTNGDGVIRNSLCVGFDCPDAPAFGDSTILMMENNTRIKFGDTSNSASFPNNDWEIEANSSVNGGANYLGFNDCGTADNDGGCATDLVFAVEAGARSSALYVESDGDIGIGTSNPVVDIHVVTGNTPTLRLDQDGSAGFTPQVWDVAGNETNFFIRDVTAGSRLPLRIRPGAATSSIDIANDGDVFIGLAPSSNSGDLVVGGSGNKFVDLASTDNGAVQYRLISTSANRRIVAKDDDAAVPDGQIQFLNNSIVLIRDANNQMATFSNTGLAVIGSITTTGGGTCDPGPCDGVFDPAAYEVESIEDHAAFMWDNKYLWGVGPTPEEGPINLGQKTTGILHELEKAHIYIAELNDQLKSQGAEIKALKALITPK